jgi:hypothetical protein
MRKIYASIWIFVCLFAGTAVAQDANSASTQKTVEVDIKIVDMEARTPEAMEEVRRDQKRWNQQISEGKIKLIASTRVLVLSNERSSVRIGQRIPIQTQSLPAFRPTSTTQTTQPTLEPLQTAVGVPQIQYENTGLNFEIQPRLRSDSTIDLFFKIELTGLSNDTGKLTPTFINRTLTNAIKVKPNQPTMIFEMYQNELLWAPPPQTNSSTTQRGNFFILLSAKVVE